MLFEILEERMAPSEVVELLNEFTKDDLENYAIKNMICPYCGNDLKIINWQEEREYQGRPTFENISELVCYSCGNTYSNNIY